MYEISVKLENINNVEKEDVIKKVSELLRLEEVKGQYNIYKIEEDTDEN